METKQNEKMIKRLYLGPNGVGKTKKINEYFETFNKNDENIIFMITNNINVEIFNSKPTDPNFNKSYWNNFSEKINNLTTFNIENIKQDSFNDEIKEVITNKYNESFNSVNSNEINLIDGITEKIFDDENAKISFSKEDITEISSDLKFSIMKKSLKEQLKLLVKNTEKNRGTGNYQYLTIKFIYEFVKVGILNQAKLDKTYLIIDEPEIYLHPSLKRRVGYMLEEISKHMNVIISSHCEIISSILIKNHEIEVYKFFENDKPELIEITNKGRKIGEAARVSFVRNLFAEKIMIVEGSDDLELIEYIISQFNLSDIITNYNVHISDKKSNIKNIYISLTKWYGIKPENIMIIFDKDLDKEKECINHKSINKEIHDLNLNEDNIFWFEDKMEADLETSKIQMEKHIELNTLDEFFEPLSQKEKYKELQEKIKSFISRI